MSKHLRMGLVALALCSSAAAEPTSGLTLVTAVRPYVPDRVYVQVRSSNLCYDAAARAFTTWFSIDLSTPAGKAMYSNVLVALTSGRYVALEVWDPSCQPALSTTSPWGALLRSVYLY